MNIHILCYIVTCFRIFNWLLNLKNEQVQMLVKFHCFGTIGCVHGNESGLYKIVLWQLPKIFLRVICRICKGMS